MVSEKKTDYVLRSGRVTVSGTVDGEACIFIEDAYVSSHDEALDVVGQIIKLLQIVKEINGGADSHWMRRTEKEGA